MSTEDTSDKIRTTLTTGAEKVIPSVMSKRKQSLQYISADLARKMSLRDRLERQSKKTGKAGPETRYKKLKNECQQQLRNEHNQHVENLLTDEENPSGARNSGPT